MRGLNKQKEEHSKIVYTREGGRGVNSTPQKNRAYCFGPKLDVQLPHWCPQFRVVVLLEVVVVNTVQIQADIYLRWLPLGSLLISLHDTTLVI